jgi:hypothetical protein
VQHVKSALPQLLIPLPLQPEGVQLLQVPPHPSLLPFGTPSHSGVQLQLQSEFWVWPSGQLDGHEQLQSAFWVWPSGQLDGHEQLQSEFCVWPSGQLDGHEQLQSAFWV